jgi:hypothetical protein
MLIMTKLKPARRSKNNSNKSQLTAQRGGGMKLRNTTISHSADEYLVWKLVGIFGDIFASWNLKSSFTFRTIRNKLIKIK